MIIRRWRDFEARLAAKGLDWALSYAPRDLRYARSMEHPRGADLSRLLPKAYQAFVAEVGYPVLGFARYDRETFSFLPPDPMARLSVDLPDDVDGEFVFPEPSEAGPTLPGLAFFAGYDLSDINGYAFKPEAEGEEPIVWCVEDGGPVEPIGSFDEWLAVHIEHCEAFVDGLDASAAYAMKQEHDDDPHRLIDYSLERSFIVAPYAADDLRLSWVEEQSGSPYSYGLVDETGTYRIPLGKRFMSVRSFRDGRAEVIVNDGTSSYSGPWRKIDLDGNVVD